MESCGRRQIEWLRRPEREWKHGEMSAQSVSPGDHLPMRSHTLSCRLSEPQTLVHVKLHFPWYCPQVEGQIWDLSHSVRHLMTSASSRTGRGAGASVSPSLLPAVALPPYIDRPPGLPIVVLYPFGQQQQHEENRTTRLYCHTFPVKFIYHALRISLQIDENSSVTNSRQL